eukprot:m.22127 g.22127  ORF g.22127 m.22127 type:complete len:736 (+) comp7350_c0_seq1:165-2372(+)
MLKTSVVAAVVCFTTVSAQSQAELQKKYAKDSKNWHLVFRQKAPKAGGTEFFAANRWRANADDTSSALYSVLDGLENYRDMDTNKIVFKMRWPGLCAPSMTNNECAPDKRDYNIWMQDTNMYTEKVRGTKGFVDIDVYYTPSDDGDSRKFQGLENNLNENTLADGVVNSRNWAYALGAFRVWRNGHFPAAIAPSGANMEAAEIELYAWGPPTVEPGNDPEWKLVLRLSNSKWNTAADGKLSLDVNSGSANPISQSQFVNLEPISAKTEGGKLTFKIVFPELCKVNCPGERNFVIFEQTSELNSSQVTGLRVLDAGPYTDFIGGLRFFNDGKAFGFGVRDDLLELVPGSSVCGDTCMRLVNGLIANSVEVYAWDSHVLTKKCKYQKEYYDVNKDDCVPLKVCQLGSSYESKAPTKVSDRECTSVTQCDSESYELTPPSLLEDRGCAPLTQCLDSTLEFEVVAPTDKSDRVCQKHPLCDSSFQYEASPPTGTSQRICVALNVCDKGEQYELTPPTTTTNRVCKEISECEGDTYTMTEATTTTDANCQPAKKCGNDEYVLAEAVGSEDTKCEKLTAECSPQQLEKVAATESSDRVCLDFPLCTPPFRVSSMTMYCEPICPRCDEDEFPTAPCTDEGRSCMKTTSIGSGTSSSETQPAVSSDGDDLVLTAAEDGAIVANSQLIVQGVNVPDMLGWLSKDNEALAIMMQQLIDNQRMLKARIEVLEMENKKLKEFANRHH